ADSLLLAASNASFGGSLFVSAASTGVCAVGVVRAVGTLAASSRVWIARAGVRGDESMSALKTAELADSEFVCPISTARGLGGASATGEARSEANSGAGRFATM